MRWTASSKTENRLIPNRVRFCCCQLQNAVRACFSHISRHIGLEKGSLRIYMSIDNVATITGYSGIDPEVGNYGVDAGVYPVSRFFNFGVNVNF